jgi:hypothetical protein
MHGTLRNVNVVVAVGAAMLLVMSVWPGYASGCWYVIGLGLAALLGISWLFVVLRIRYHRRPLGFRAAAFAPLIVVVTYLLLTFYVPRRIAFRAALDQFEAMLPSAPAATENGARPLNRRLGVYRVDQYAADPRGGVYFRTGAGQDGIGPDRMSFGFVHRPNPSGTPFGAARYLFRPLGGDWYWFQASDDWH